MVLFGFGIVGEYECEFRLVVGRHVDVDACVLHISFDADGAAAVNFSVIYRILFLGRVIDQHIVYIRDIQGIFDIFEVFVSHDAVHFSQVIFCTCQCHVIDDNGIGGKSYRVGNIKSGVEIVDSESKSVDVCIAFYIQGLESPVEVDFPGSESVYVL